MRRGFAALVAVAILGTGVAETQAAGSRQGALAVAIGNSDYVGDTPDVPYATNDAAAFADWFEEIGLESRRILRRENMTGAQMHALFGAEGEPGLLARLAATGVDEIFVFYSGHGAPRIRANGVAEGFLLPVDVEPANPQFGGYSLEALTEVLEALPVERVTLFLDACFSGLSQGGALVPQTSASFGVAIAEPVTRARVVTLAATAFDEAQFAHWLEEEEQGAFTAYTLRALRGEADRGAGGDGDGLVSLPEVHDFLRREMTFDLLMTYGRNQTASLTGESADILFAALPEPAPDLTPAKPLTALPVPEPEEAAVPDPDARQRCDRLAASPFDAEAPSFGGPLTELTADAAVAACRSAVAADPEVPRYAYQLGRALAARQDPEAMDWLRSAADTGHVSAWHTIGAYQMRGDLGGQDQARGVRWLRLAAEAGNPSAMKSLGNAYRDGRGVPADPAAAEDWYRGAIRGFKRLAAAGNAAAMNELGRMYGIGQGVPRDPAEAARWYRQSAEAGYHWGMHNLAWRYRQGDGVERNFARAFELFEQSAEIGNPSGMNMLGSMYQNGQGVAQDDARALEFYLEAAAAGEGWGARNAAKLVEKGRGAARDPVRVRELYQRARILFEPAAAGGDRASMNGLGLLYEYGEGVEQDDAQALSHYRDAAAAGYAPGAVNAGKLLRKGRGAPRDYAAALAYFEEAAAAGNGTGMNMLGIMHEYGQGVPKDDTKALGHYLDAAAAGSSWGARNAGIFFRNGRGTARDFTRARVLLEQAAEAGNGRAMNTLGRMHEVGEGVPSDQSEAVRWYRRAADAGNETGARNFALFLSRGKGIARDDEAAADMYARALSLGSKTARTDLTTRARTYSATFWRRMQRILAEAGHYSSAIDGVPGPATRRAVEA
ncbi:MAG: caspase family protein, partial [Pseudomonadota bacterium]